MSAIAVQPAASSRAAAKLAEVRGFVFDIDGTLALADKRLSGYQPLPGACELLAPGEVVHRSGQLFGPEDCLLRANSIV